VHLVQVDALGTEAAQRRLRLGPDARRRAGDSAYTWHVSVALPAARPVSPAAAALLRQAHLRS
jgi:hypothetical protein